MSRKSAYLELLKQAILLLGISVLVVIEMEWLNHRSFSKFFLFLREHPVMFLVNVQIVFNTFMFGEMWRRRRAWRWTIFLMWMALGVANYMVTSYRILPFTTRDFLLIKDGLKMITVYFTWPEIIAMFGAIAALIAGIALLFIKMKPRKSFNRLASITVFVLILAVTLLTGKLAVEARWINWERKSLVKAYSDFGFAYCFTYTFADFGIEKPEEYSEELVDEIAEDIVPVDKPLIVEPDETVEEPEEITPNILFVQMESFFDVNGLLDTEFSENPIPVFTELKEKWPSGALKVPSVGGGTANTEFEVLTGMNLDYFGAGEYPYNTVLSDTTCETICFNLAPLGYTSTAIHNYMGTFYSRDTVYSQLGFNRFVSQEYMNDLEYNPLGWAKDHSLTGEIFQALETTEGRDFVFTVTVQSHGKYPNTPIEGLDTIQVLSCREPVDEVMLSNFVNELYEVDQFIGDLIAELETFDEPVVLVLYGDHLPALEIEDEGLECGDMFQTTYVIWNNFGMDFEAPDLEAYRLTANLLKQLGIDNGVLTHYHQAAAPDEDGDGYLAFLRVLEYDMLYGDLVIYNGENPYEPTDLQMGTVPITISSATYSPSTGTFAVLGENFTPFSSIVVNGERLDTVFDNSGKILAKVASLEPDSEAYVGQFTKENEELSRTEIIKVQEK